MKKTLPIVLLSFALVLSGCVSSGEVEPTYRDFESVFFDSKTLIYDGESHILDEVRGAPEGTQITYTGRETHIDAGTYTASALLTKEGYNNKTLTATLTITPIELTNSGYFYSRVYLYDGQNHSVYVDSAPSGVTITYKCLNASGTNTFKNIGVYEVEATVKSDINHLSKKYATLTITTPATVSIDSSKTPLTIDENLKWDQLYDALENGNFTMKSFTGSYDVEHVDDDAPSNLLNDTFEGHTSGYIFASNGKEAFQHSYSLNNSDTTNYYDYYKDNGNDIIRLEFDDEYNQGTAVKFPKEAFKETITYSYASNAFASLTKGENGEFLTGIDGDDYYKNVGIPYIDNGVFTVLMEHPREISAGYRYFYEIVKFYNIGNTIVDVPSNYLPSKDYIDTKMGVDKFYLGGVEYGTEMFGTASHYNYYYTAQLYVDYHRAIFLKPDTYTVLAKIYDRIVKAIIYTNSSYAYNNNQSGYNFRLYVDSNGVYQGEYSGYEPLARFTISSFINNGGTVEYYDQWHN